MYISKVQIVNFRNFGSVPFQMELKPLTLIVGENNIGKSNLLVALSMIFPADYVTSPSRNLQAADINQAAITHYRSQVQQVDVPVDQVKFPEISIQVWMTGLTDEQKSIVGDWFTGVSLDEASVIFRYSLRANFDKKKWVESQRESLEKLRLERGLDSSESLVAFVDLPIQDYRSVLVGGTSGAECEAHHLNMLRVEVLDALRDARRELTSGEGRLLYRILRSGAHEKYLDLKQQLVALHDAIHKNAALQGLKADIGALLSEVSLVDSAADNSVDFRFSSPDANDLLQKIAIIYGTDPVPVERNGLGRNNLLYLALLLSQLCKPFGDTAGTDRYVGYRLIGVEEPEAHLHPHLQEHLSSNLELIRKKQDQQLQLILTSHSTHISAKVDLANTAVIFRDESTKTLRGHYVLQGFDKVADKHVKRFLSLYLDATKSKMLFARSILLVEGIAEQTLVPKMYQRLYGRTLDSIGCTVVNVQGLAFRPFLRVVSNGFFKKCVVLTDLDSGTDMDERGEKLAKDFKDVASISVHITEESTFEKDVIKYNSTTPEASETLWKALVDTRPTNGPALKDSSKGVVAMDAFFEQIESHKAAFAFNLAAIISDVKEVLHPPPYLTAAFVFLEGA